MRPTKLLAQRFVTPEELALPRIGMETARRSRLRPAGALQLPRRAGARAQQRRAGPNVLQGLRDSATSAMRCRSSPNLCPCPFHSPQPTQASGLCCKSPLYGRNRGVPLFATTAARLRTYPGRAPKTRSRSCWRGEFLISRRHCARFCPGFALDILELHPAMFTPTKPSRTTVLCWPMGRLLALSLARQPPGSKCSMPDSAQRRRRCRPGGRSQRWHRWPNRR